MNQSPSPAEASPIVTDVVRRLHRIFQAVDLFSKRALRNHGVTGPQIWALRTIHDAECTTMPELAQRLHLQQSAVSVLVDPLEEHELASRHRSLEGVGIPELWLTSVGRRLVSSVAEPPCSNIARGVEGLSLAELKDLHRAVGILRRVLEVPEPAGEKAEPKG
jgi:DNA-binding MarR family transcriptional regulator